MQKKYCYFCPKKIPWVGLWDSNLAYLLMILSGHKVLVSKMFERFIVHDALGLWLLCQKYYTQWSTSIKCANPFQWGPWAFALNLSLSKALNLSSPSNWTWHIFSPRDVVHRQSPNKTLPKQLDLAHQESLLFLPCALLCSWAIWLEISFKVG